MAEVLPTKSAASTISLLHSGCTAILASGYFCFTSLLFKIAYKYTKNDI